VPCYHPLQAYKTAAGEVVFYESARHDIVRSLSLPCGQCVVCRLERSRQWAVRCMHEASLYERNCFLTLTYNDENLPKDMSLHYDHFQKFMKRFRKSHKGFEPSSNGKYPIRYYMAGEYGEQFGRPHFHACVFNYDFDDKVFFKSTGSGSRIYTSATLEGLWPYGYSSIGDVNFQSAAYVARYIMKKITGKVHVDDSGKVVDPERHYEHCDLETGELVKRTPEFNKMSLKPGIGFDWFQEYKTDVYPHDYVIVNGKKVRPPRFYDKKFKVEHPEEFEVIEFNRESSARKRYEDNTDERLAVKEKVAKARLRLLKREI
jgi:hypothetical protein